MSTTLSASATSIGCFSVSTTASASATSIASAFGVVVGGYVNCDAGVDGVGIVKAMSTALASAILLVVVFVGGDCV